MSGENMMSYYCYTKKYNMNTNIDPIISDILRINFQLNKKSLKILRHCDIRNSNAPFSVDVFSEQDLLTFNIVKEIGIIPKEFNISKYRTTKIYANVCICIYFVVSFWVKDPKIFYTLYRKASLKYM